MNITPQRPKPDPTLFRVKEVMDTNALRVTWLVQQLIGTEWQTVKTVDTYETAYKLMYHLAYNAAELDMIVAEINAGTLRK